MAAAKRSELEKLHNAFTQYLIGVLQDATDAGDSIPLDAATMGCISRFLKDNDITCAPEDLTSLDELRKKYSASSRASTVQQATLGGMLNAAREAELLN